MSRTGCCCFLYELKKKTTTKYGTLAGQPIFKCKKQTNEFIINGNCETVNLILIFAESMDVMIKDGKH